jgi:hypothetical protein
VRIRAGRKEPSAGTLREWDWRTGEGIYQIGRHDEIDTRLLKLHPNRARSNHQQIKAGVRHLTGEHRVARGATPAPPPAATFVERAAYFWAVVDCSMFTSGFRSGEVEPAARGPVAARYLPEKHSRAAEPCAAGQQRSNDLSMHQSTSKCVQPADECRAQASRRPGRGPATTGRGSAVPGGDPTGLTVRAC